MNKVFRGLCVLFCTCCFFYSESFCSLCVLRPEEKHVTKLSWEVAKMINKAKTVAYATPERLHIPIDEARKMAIRAYIGFKGQEANLHLLDKIDRCSLDIMRHQAYGALIRLYGLKEEFWDEFLAKMDGIASLQYDEIPGEVYSEVSAWVEAQKGRYLTNNTHAN